MNNTMCVTELCSQLEIASKRISSLSCSMNAVEASGNADLLAIFDGQRLDELEHIQHLVLALTQCIMPEPLAENADEGGSVFAEGDLTDNLGDKTDYEAEVVQK